MSLLRSTVTDFGNKQGKDTVEITVRAASKPGAMLAARLKSFRIIPFREQQVIEVDNLSNDRILDKWVIQVQDTSELSKLGQ